MTSPLGASAASSLVAGDSLEGVGVGGVVPGGVGTPEIKQPSRLV